MKQWDGKDLVGLWNITRKIDGVQAIITENGAVSRKGKPLHNLKNIPPGTYEIFKNNWETSVSMVRTHDSTLVDLKDAYNIGQPFPDVRLLLFTDTNIPAKFVEKMFKDQVAQGHEGLVLWGPNNEKVKVKPVETYDVEVIGYQDGKGKHVGRLGALLTRMGKVGTGFKDEQRDYKLYPIGSTIEVRAMGLTPSGKFRHPRFVRARFDK